MANDLNGVVTLNGALTNVINKMDTTVHWELIKNRTVAATVVVPGYNFIKKLFPATNGFGAVLLYRNNKTHAIVAIKQVSYMNDGENNYDAVLNEIIGMINIKHPNIVSYHEYFVIGQRHELYIVQEYAKRGSLRHMLTEHIVNWEYLPQNTVVKIVRDIICGVQYLLSLKIVVSELKPENIMIGDNGYSKICDYRAPFDVKSRHFRYMAYELFDGRCPDEKTIVWSLGIILYEMCTFQHPFQPFANFTELIQNIKAGRFKSINLSVADYSSDMQEIIESMLHENRSKRKTLVELLGHNLMRIKPPVSYFVWLCD